MLFCDRTVDVDHMEEAERVFQDAESCESNSDNRRASKLYTTFINQVKSSPNKLQL